MKRTVFVLGLAVAAGAVAASADEGDHAGARHRGMDRARLMEKYDTNKDGKLDDQERAALRQDMEARRAQHRQWLLEKYDANHDGKLDEQERAAMRADRKAHREEFLKRFDTDGDGKLSQSEREAMRAQLRQEKGWK
ncbi:MAG TPA: EF-hand domain-containing protein [Vicinamibacteria bacterium]|jgi:Ca2+-binding EF-hand superfamily protein|nr:EF-hand domain-containing protein [Vicinamibacteria bacterium]